MSKRLTRVSNDNITQLKYLIRGYLTDCPVKLSSENFKDELIKFFWERGIDSVYDVKVSKTTVTIYFDIDGLVGTSIWVTKEIFE